MVGTGTTFMSSMSATTPIMRCGALFIIGTNFRSGSFHVR